MTVGGSAAPVHLYRAILTFLASAPSPAEIAAYTPPSDARQRLQILLERSRAGELTTGEHAELDEFERIEHLTAVLKSGARSSLTVAP